MTSHRKPPIERLLIDPSVDRSALAVLRKEQNVSLKKVNIREKVRQITFDGLAQDMEFVFDLPDSDDDEEEQTAAKKRPRAIKSTRAGYA